MVQNEPFLYRGEDCMDVFVKKMIEVKDDNGEDERKQGHHYEGRRLEGL